MSIEEYHALQRANEAQNQMVRSLAGSMALRLRLGDVRRHIEAAMARIDQGTTPEAWSELEKALARLAEIRP
jgi:hypothetical protein